jgi:hypothetical protein
MRKLLTALGTVLVLAAPAVSAAGGCYVCGAGSAVVCRDYCRYDGADTFDARHRCAAKGCRVSGTSTCPSQGGQGGAQVCEAPRNAGAGTVAQCEMPAPPRG